MNTIQERKREMIDKNKFQVVVDNPNDAIVGRLCENFEVALNWYREEVSRIPADTETVPFPGKMLVTWHQTKGNVYEGRRMKHGMVGLYERMGDDWVLMERMRFNRLCSEVEPEAEGEPMLWLMTHDQLSDTIYATIELYEEFLGHKADAPDPKESAKYAAAGEVMEGLGADAQMKDEGYVRSLSLMGGS